MMKKFTGYHGTHKGNIKSIKEQGFRIKKYSFTSTKLQKVPGDLGEGVYAYEDEENNAKRFIQKIIADKDIAVLKLELSVEEEKFLDMDSPESKAVMKEIYNSKILSVMKKRYKNSVGSTARDCLDGLLIEHIINKRNLRIDLVKKETYTPFKDYPALSHFPNGIELCIKNSGIIKAFEQVI